MTRHEAEQYFEYIFSLYDMKQRRKKVCKISLEFSFVDPDEYATGASGDLVKQAEQSPFTRFKAPLSSRNSPALDHKVSEFFTPLTVFDFSNFSLTFILDQATFE